MFFDDDSHLDKLNFQEIVFKRWINHILSKKNVKIENFYTDLGNGVYLVYLIEILTRYEFKAKIKNPSFRTQKMENITMILKYLQENEHIKYLNIDSSNILNKEKKLVLSFIWHIIEYFSIIKPIETYFVSQNVATTGKSIKQKFMNWLKSKVPRTIKNLTTDLQNGIIIGALVNSCDERLCPNWNNWQEKDASNNARIAMEIAEQELGVPSLIKPEELVNGELDEKSIMTYLSQFILCRSFCKPIDLVDVPLKDDDIVPDQTTLHNFIHVKGRGVQELGIRIGDSVKFTIDKLNNPRFKVEQIIVKIKDPGGICIHCDRQYDCEALQCSYTPLIIGLYEISILIQKPKLNKIFMIHVDDECFNQIVAFGPGLSFASLGEVAMFMVDTNGETGTLNFSIEGPDEAQIECKDNEDGSATVKYWPKTPGEYAVHILYEDKDIHNSPFMVDVKLGTSSLKPSKVRAYGPALCEGDITIGEATNFTVDVSKENCRLDLISVECFDRFGGAVHADIVREGGCKRTYSLVPVTPERLTLWICYDNVCVSGSPYKIIVAQDKISNKIRVQGSGLQSASAGVEAIFFVDCRTVTLEGELQVLITDYHMRPIPCSVIRNSKDLKIYSVKYVPPSNITQCFIDIIYDSIVMYDKPFIVPILESSSNDILYKANRKNLNYNLEQVPVTEPSTYLPDYTNIFLGPGGESYTKLMTSSESDFDNPSKSEMPLPPPDLTDDSGDTSIEIRSAKFPLSTVLEESEDNCSIRNSIFGSESHSRSSTKEDCISLSRKSSFTMPHSPTVIYSKPDFNPNLDEIISEEWPRDLPRGGLHFTKPFIDKADGSTKSLNSLPPRPEQRNNQISQFEDNFDEDFPLPAPPLDFELISLNKEPSISLKSSRMDIIKVEIEEISLIDKFDAFAPSITHERDTKDSSVKISNYIYLICIPRVVINVHYFSKNSERTVRVFINTDASLKENKDFDSTLIDEKFDTEMLPVSRMEAILSPCDGNNYYSSDNSEQSIISDKTPTIITARYHLSSTPLIDLSREMRRIDQLFSENIIIVEHQWPFLKLRKEMTTSEVSEISETSQWISNEEKVLNQQLEIEENSLSDLPKSGMCTLVSNKYFTDGVHFFNNTNNCKCNNKAVKWVMDQGDNLEVFPNSIIENKTVRVNNSLKIHQQEASGEHDSYLESLFLEPPSEMMQSNNDNHNFSHKSQSGLKEGVKVKKSNLIVFKRPDEGATFNYLDTVRSNPCSEMDNIFTSKRNDLTAERLCSFSKDLPQPPFTFRKTDFVNENVVNNLLLSVNKPLLMSAEPSNHETANNLSDNLKTPVQKNFEISKSMYKGNFPIKEPPKQKDVSYERIFNDFQRPTLSYRRRFQRKRRSFSQTYSDDYSNHFDFAIANNNILYGQREPKEFNRNKPHSRARSKSDNQVFDLDFEEEENTPIKLEKKEEVLQMNCKHFSNESLNPGFSETNKEVITKKPLTESECTPLLSHYGNETIVKTLNCETKNSTFTSLTSQKEKRYIGIGEKEIENITVEGEGLSIGFVGKAAEFIIKTKGKGTEGISLALEGPSETEMGTIGLPNGDCRVKYIPKSSGEYLLHIQQDGLQVSGSPFRISVSACERASVTTAEMLLSEKAYAEGQGLTCAYRNYPNHFTIYTKDSGPGGLSLSIEGPSKAFIEFQDSKNGACGVTYRVSEAGLYSCIVKFNKNHIKDSPFSINITHQPPILTNIKQNKGPVDKTKCILQIGKKAHFKTPCSSIDTEGISKLVAVLSCPNGSKQQLGINKDCEENLIWVEFIPRMKGYHKLHFLDESQQLGPQGDDNSFLLLVEEAGDIDQTCFERELNSIKVYGKGLVKGRAGYSNIFFIEIGESVSGALNVTVDGPSKVEIKCNETDKGFRFSYIPGIPGDYLVTIKYGGERQIKGSPFQVKITVLNKGHKQSCLRRKLHSSQLSQSNMNETCTTTFGNENDLVTCYGSGLNKGRMGTWMNFYVDASKTNSLKHLLVGIIGPKEPCEEIRVAYVKNSRFLVSYMPTERGEHQVVIKWGECHVPGSPCTVLIEP